MRGVSHCRGFPSCHKVPNDLSSKNETSLPIKRPTDDKNCHDAKSRSLSLHFRLNGRSMDDHFKFANVQANLNSVQGKFPLRFGEYLVFWIGFKRRRYWPSITIIGHSSVCTKKTREIPKINNSNFLLRQDKNISATLKIVRSKQSTIS